MLRGLLWLFKSPAAACLFHVARCLLSRQCTRWSSLNSVPLTRTLLALPVPLPWEVMALSCECCGCLDTHVVATHSLLIAAVAAVQMIYVNHDCLANHVPSS